MALGICGRSAIENPAGNTCCPAQFNRNEDWRYWLLPRIAATKCPIKPRASSGTNNTAARRVLNLRGPKRAIVRRALSRPMASACSNSCQSRALLYQ
jgi:hypothetical protein